jgi:hypothetical protein
LPDQTAAERLMTGKSWEEFCDTLKSAGKTISPRARPRIRSIARRASAT